MKEEQKQLRNQNKLNDFKLNRFKCHVVSLLVNVCVYDHDVDSLRDAGLLRGQRSAESLQKEAFSRDVINRANQIF